MENKHDLSKPPTIQTENGPAIDCVASAKMAANAERDNEIFVLENLSEHDELIVRTQNSIYSIKRIGQQYTIKGGTRWYVTTPITINGSTFGGSMLLMGRIGIGMFMEFETYKGTYTTSRIESWSLTKGHE